MHALSVDISEVGSAVDGGGALGNLGQGVWVESAFDLSSFAGRSIKVRFLFSGIRMNLFAGTTWEDIFVFNPDEREDGWLIDDLTVTYEPLEVPALSVWGIVLACCALLLVLTWSMIAIRRERI